jgi:integrase
MVDVGRPAPTIPVSLRRAFPAVERQSGLLAEITCIGPPLRIALLEHVLEVAPGFVVVPLRVVLEALQAHLTAHDVKTGDLLFTLDGGPISRQAFGHKWRPSPERQGSSRAPACTLRHYYYASPLIRHGESVKTIQARLGHASAAETLDTYSHLWPEFDDRTREAVDMVLGASADSLRTAEG